MTKKTVIALFVGLIVSTGAIANQWNLADDFSVTNNRNNQWAYGTTITPGRFTIARKIGPLGRYTFNLGGAAAWQGTVGSGPEFYPFIAKFYGQQGTIVNLNDALTGGITNVNVRAGGVLMHPGPNGEYAVVRWRSRDTTVYYVSAVFFSCDATQGATTDVQVLKNNNVMFKGVISGPTSTASWSSSNNGITVAQGDSLDFLVGTGGNGFGFDSTCLDVSIRTLDIRSSNPAAQLTSE